MYSCDKCATYATWPDEYTSVYRCVFCTCNASERQESGGLPRQQLRVEKAGI